MVEGYKVEIFIKEVSCSSFSAPCGLWNQVISRWNCTLQSIENQWRKQFDDNHSWRSKKVCWLWLQKERKNKDDQNSKRQTDCIKFSCCF